ncbi:ricin-type beta-trefoil lectin domain protein [Streptomyces sp. NPDC020800]|uniref:ricin-type beta-trefoil lectin domain protein n=1 Tax=Streptomyces sp. NPDC020800 TaxID=3365092 RepID=UPI003787286E
MGEMSEVHTMSDGQLTISIRAPMGTAAADQLRRRHESAALAYASICCRTKSAAQELVGQVFSDMLCAAQRGDAPAGAWRPHLLTAIQNTAAAWSRTKQRSSLSTSFVDSLAEQDQESLLRSAYLSLSESFQIILWHRAVEQEPDDTTAMLAGCAPGAVKSLARRAQEGLREACLRIHAEKPRSEECRRLSSLLGARIHSSGRHTSQALERHLDACTLCMSIVVTLEDLQEQLGICLSSAFLQWASLPYIAFRTAPAGASAAAPITTEVNGNTDCGQRRSALVTVAWGAATLTVAIGLVSVMHFPDIANRTVSPADAHTPSPIGIPTASVSLPTTARHHQSQPSTNADIPTASVSLPATIRPETASHHQSHPSTNADTKATTSPHAGPDTGVRWRSPSSGRCLAVPDEPQPNGVQLNIWDCNDSADQIWTLTPLKQLTVYNGTRCLDALGGATSPGTVIDVYSCNGGLHQQWNINHDGTITNAASGLCLDVVGSDTRNGAKIDLWPCHGGKNQQWSSGSPGRRHVGHRRANQSHDTPKGHHRSEDGRATDAAGLVPSVNATGVEGGLADPVL